MTTVDADLAVRHLDLFYARPTLPLLPKHRCPDTHRYPKATGDGEWVTFYLHSLPNGQGQEERRETEKAAIALRALCRGIGPAFLTHF